MPPSGLDGDSSSVSWTEDDINNLALAHVYKDNDRPITSLSFSASGKKL